MKVFLFCVVSLLSACSCFAQDTIIKKNNSIIVSQVTEILPGHVKYKKYINLSGPVYTIPKKDVAYIRYSNGTVDTLNPFIPSIKSRNDSLASRVVTYGRHIAYLSITDFAFQQATFGYEFIFGKGQFSVKVPISFGLNNAGITSSASPVNGYVYELNNDKAFYNPDKIFSAGVDLAFFPRGQGMVRYFFGPGIDYGQYNYYLRWYDPNATSSFPYVFIETRERNAFVSLMFRNGVVFQPLTKLTLTANLGLGVYNLRQKTYNYDGSSYYDETRTRPAIQGSINAGYRF